MLIYMMLKGFEIKISLCFLKFSMIGFKLKNKVLVIVSMKK